MGELRGVGLSVLLLLGGLLAVRGVAGESAPRRAAEAKAAADDDASAAPAPAGACSAGQQLIDEYRALYGGERSTFRHLIVLIPDPVALRGRESFDSVFEGVEEAFAQSIDGARYVRDRHWFPLTDAPAAAACWEQEPGFVIYRPVAGTGAPPILALFVGETPTWGLRVAAMRRALALAAAPAPPSRQTPFRYHILGPSFSGTAASLAAVLESVPGSAAIVSGTATNDDAIAMLSAAATARGSSFASVAPSDVELLRALGKFLRTRGGDCRRDGNMVLFTESGTTYGQAKDKDACFRILKFPPDLAAIRQAYEANGAAPDSPMPLTRAPIAGATAHRALALGDMLRSLGDQRVRFAGIMATDARDVVFMANRIREQLPDVRLFTLGADLTYLHEQHARALNGMIIAHGRRAQASELRSTGLASELVHDVYLAARDLLERTYSARPEVHISFVGNGTLWELDPPAECGTVRAPTSWWLVLALATLLFLAVAAVVLLGGSTLTRRPGRAWALLRPCVHVDLADGDRLLLAMLLMVTACPLALMRAASSRDGVLELGLAIVLALVMLAVPWGYLLIQRRRANRFALMLAAAASISATLALYLGCGPERASTFYLASGGSPVLVALMGLAGFATALWCSHVRLRMLDTHRFEGRRGGGATFAELAPPIATAVGESDRPEHGVFVAERKLLLTLKDPWPHNAAARAALVAALVLAALPFAFRWPHTFEPVWRNRVLVGVGILATLPALGGLTRLLVTGHRLMRLLRRLAACPAVAALARLPKALARPLEAQLAYSVSSSDELQYAVQALRRLAETRPELAARADECDALLCGMRAAQGRGESADDRRQLVSRLIAIAGELNAGRGAGAPPAPGIDDLTATLVAVFIPRYVRHFRTIAPQLAVSGIAGILLTSLYFAQPQRYIATVVFMWTAVTVVAVFGCYLALVRDPVLAAIAAPGGAGGAIKWPIVRRVVAWLLLPAASLLPVQFPEVSLWVTQLLTGLAKGFE